MSFTVIHEQRVNLKFLVKLGTPRQDALRMLRTVYGPDTMARSCFYEWYKRFKAGRDDVVDEPRSGRPVTACTPENVRIIGEAVKANRGASIRKISAMTEVKKGTVRQIMVERLKIKFAAPAAKK